MKKKILISSFILVIIIIIASVFVFYKVQEENKTLKVSSNDTNDTKEEIIEETKENNSNEELPVETQEKIEEKTKENVIQNTKEETTENTTENNKRETQKINTIKNEQIKKEDFIETPKEPQPQTQTTGTTQETKEETPPKQEVAQIDLSKYDRYEKASDGGYRAFKKSDSEMSKLRGLIDNCIKEFGYTNVKVIKSNSVPQGTQYFTANKTNVENKVYNSEDFTIYYYAETEYWIKPNGTESIFQYRSYIDIQ